MTPLGIKFIPLSTPLEKYQQAISSIGMLALTIAISGLGVYFMYYLVMHTKYGIIAWLYFIWIFFIDNDAILLGSRRSEWVRSWRIWVHAKDHYPVTISKLPHAKFNPRRNYILATFPHGILPNGGFIAFGTNACEQKRLFPNHDIYLTVLSMHFKIPFLREFYSAFGFCGPASKSINHILNKPSGGNMVVLYVGGVQEALRSHPGVYHLFLKQRKGFIKLALQNGSPIVPVFSFGENEIYNQIENPEGSLLRTIQNCVKDTFGFGLIAPKGRGVFQYNFGFIPYSKPVSILVGAPIEVPKVIEPTNEEIDALHSVFIEKLQELFEQNKHKYVENYEEVKLIID